MATALYRRYRPEAFTEMIGQAHVTEPLMTALRTGRIGHAYLFSGPRGCGKTTSARILARCLNCAEGPTDVPCGTCPSCVELSRDGGGSLDVVEIDAASHGGVDDARDLRERAVFAPARDRYKIFIIDEAHMVTAGGFNALLKIVEEPPPHVKFIFATTEPEKVIGTIRSRTHHYPFRLIAPGALIDYVQQLCDSEGVAVEAGVLALVVRAGGGSVRDTLSILDQLIAGSEEGGVTRARATGLLGFTSADLLDEVVAALGSGDSAAAFAATDRVVQTGQDPRRFVEDLLERLRDLIVIGATTVQGASAVFRGVPDEQLQRMFEQAQLFSPAQLSKIADTVSAALDSMTGATAPRLHLELMVARAMVTGAAARRAGEPSRVGVQEPSAAGGQRAASRPAASARPPMNQPAPPQRSEPQPATSQPPMPPPPAVSRPPAESAPSGAGAAVAPEPQPTVAAPTTPAAPGSTQNPPPVDVVAAMRSAREFLNSDSSGAAKPPMVPLGGHPPQAEQTAPEPGAGEDSAQVLADAPPHSPADEPSPAPVGDAPGLDELREVWPELLAELLESDRTAWNAVKDAQPLALEGELFTVGIASRSDLEAFKLSGAGPLREAIEAALGVTVRYLPKALPAARAGREPHGSTPDAEPSPTAPSSAAPVSTGPSSTAPSAPAQFVGETAAPGRAPSANAGAGAYPTRDEEYSEPPVPAWAEPEEAMAAETPASAPAPDPDPMPDPAPAYAPDPLDVSEAETATETETETAAEPEPKTEPETAAERNPVPEPPASAPEPEPEPEPEPAPAGESLSGTASDADSASRASRYGESVVREVLGARFIEERPLPQEEG